MEIAIARERASIAAKDFIFYKTNIKYEMETELEETYKEATKKINKLRRQHLKTNTKSEDKPRDDAKAETAKTLNEITMEPYVKIDRAVIIECQRR